MNHKGAQRKKESNTKGKKPNPAFETACYKVTDKQNPVLLRIFILRFFLFFHKKTVKLHFVYI